MSSQVEKRPSSTSDMSAALNVFDRVLQLYGEILRAGWIPVFSPGMVESETHGDARALRTYLPVFDGFAAGSFVDLYRRCVKIVTVDLAREPDIASIANVHERIDSLVQTIRRSNPLGNSAMPMCRIAYDANIPFRHVSRGLVQFGWGSAARLTRHAMIDIDSAVGAGVSRSKLLSAELLRAAGYPTPQNALVSSIKEARSQAEKFGWPVVVKPNDLACSDGVTIDVRDHEKLSKAFDAARSKSASILVEKQIDGVCHRLMIVNGELAYAVRRHPKAVVGDGQSNVRELIEQANSKQGQRPPWRRLKPFLADDDAIASLARAGFDLDSVPSEGAIASLRPINSHEFGGIVEDVSEAIHAANIQLARDVARLMGLQIAGVDFMSTDVSLPWYENGGVVLEVNAGPDFMEAGRTIKQDSIKRMLSAHNGRIPVYLLVGSGNLQALARNVASELRAKGKVCQILGDDFYSSDSDMGHPLRTKGLLQRSIAVLARPDVDALLIVDEKNAFEKTGFPVDQIETAFIANDDEEQTRSIQTALTARIAVGAVKILRHDKQVEA